MQANLLNNLLQKISVVAIYKLTSGSQDQITVSEKIEHLQPLTIIGAVNIGLVSVTQEVTFISFSFSNDFLEKSGFDTDFESLKSLNWIFELPFYDYENDDSIDFIDGNVAISSEEGVANWLSRGAIDCDASFSDSFVEDLHNAYFAYESI